MIFSAARRGASSASRTVNRVLWLCCVVKRPCIWQARIRIMNMTGVRLASESWKPRSIMSTSSCMSGRGSSNHTCDFMAKA